MYLWPFMLKANICLLDIQLMCSNISPFIWKLCVWMPDECNTRTNSTLVPSLVSTCEGNIWSFSYVHYLAVRWVFRALLLLEIHSRIWWEWTNAVKLWAKGPKQALKETKPFSELRSWIIFNCGFVTVSDSFHIQVDMWSTANMKMEGEIQMWV